MGGVLVVAVTGRDETVAAGAARAGGAEAVAGTGGIGRDDVTDGGDDETTAAGDVEITAGGGVERRAAVFESARPRSSRPPSNAASTAFRSHLSASLRSPRVHIVAPTSSAVTTSSGSPSRGSGKSAIARERLPAVRIEATLFVSKAYRFKRDHHHARGALA
jgi:hypothetical protein